MPRMEEIMDDGREVTWRYSSSCFFAPKSKLSRGSFFVDGVTGAQGSFAPTYLFSLPHVGCLRMAASSLRERVVALMSSHDAPLGDSGPMHASEPFSAKSLETLASPWSLRNIYSKSIISRLEGRSRGTDNSIEGPSRLTNVSALIEFRCSCPIGARVQTSTGVGSALCTGIVVMGSTATIAYAHRTVGRDGRAEPQCNALAPCCRPRGQAAVSLFGSLEMSAPSSGFDGSGSKGYISDPHVFRDGNPGAVPRWQAQGMGDTHHLRRDVEKPGALLLTSLFCLS